MGGSLPLGGSELLGPLGVDGHGPVHAAGEALLQQQLCDVAVLKRTRWEGETLSTAKVPGLSQRR